MNLLKTSLFITSIEQIVFVQKSKNYHSKMIRGSLLCLLRFAVLENVISNAAED